MEQLIRYIVEEAPEDAEKRRTFKYVALYAHDNMDIDLFLYL